MKLPVVLQVAIYTLIFFLPFQTRLILTISQNQFAIIALYGFDILIVIVGLLWLWYWYHQTTLQPNLLASLLGCAILIVAAGSSYFGHDQNLALYYWLHLALGLWLMAIIATSPLKSDWLLGTFTLIGCIQSFTNISQFIFQEVIPNKWLGVASQLPATSGVAVVLTDSGRWLRAYGLMPHPNITGGLILLCLIATAYLSKKYWWLAVPGAVMTLGLILTFSRTALLVWCVMLVIMIIAKKIDPYFLISSLGVLIICLIIYWPLINSRITATNYVEQNSITERQDQIQEFSTVFKQRWPLGIGIGQYTSETVTPIHNVTLMILGELGVFGAIIWYWFILYPVILHKNQLISKPAAYLLLAILLLGITDHYFWTIPSLTLIWCVIIGWFYRLDRE
ncbi:MAG: O-antigen ligase family protein [Patescibacteria group bacterium]|jgi:hypothetical protein